MTVRWQSFKHETINTSRFSHFLQLLFVKSMCLINHLQVGRSCTSLSNSPISLKSYSMLSNHIHFTLLILLFPGTPKMITFLSTYSSSHNTTHPHRVTLLFCTFLDISFTFAVPLTLYSVQCCASTQAVCAVVTLCVGSDVTGWWSIMGSGRTLCTPPWCTLRSRVASAVC